VSPSVDYVNAPIFLSVSENSLRPAVHEYLAHCSDLLVPKQEVAQGHFPGTGVRPAFRIVVAASGDARKRIRALATSGWLTVLVSAPAKETSG
jgi:hypothetical protein